MMQSREEQAVGALPTDRREEMARLALAGWAFQPVGGNQFLGTVLWIGTQPDGARVAGHSLLGLLDMIKEAQLGLPA